MEEANKGLCITTSHQVALNSTFNSESGILLILKMTSDWKNVDYSWMKTLPQYDTFRHQVALNATGFIHLTIALIGCECV